MLSGRVMKDEALDLDVFRSNLRTENCVKLEFFARIDDIKSTVFSLIDARTCLLPSIFQFPVGCPSIVQSLRRVPDHVFFQSAFYLCCTY